MSSGSDYSDTEDGFPFVATQTEREIRDSIIKKYGSLPKDKFKESVVNEVSYPDLLEIRKSLYDLAVLTVKGTPQGTLAIRKDRTGGAPAADKLAEDVYLMTHYLQGDTTIDLTKCLSEKSKKEIQQRKLLNVSVFRDTENCASPSEQSSQNIPVIVEQKDISIREFCVSVLAEMRRDRDVLLTEVAALRGDSVLLKKIHVDVTDIRQELAQTRDRVSKLEVLIPIVADSGSDTQGANPTHARFTQIQHSVKRLQKRTAVVEQSIGNITSIGKEVQNQVANNYGSLTKRINQVELLLRSPDRHGLPPTSTQRPTLVSAQTSPSSANQTGFAHQQRYQPTAFLTVHPPIAHQPALDQLPVHQQSVLGAAQSSHPHPPLHQGGCTQQLVDRTTVQIPAPSHPGGTTQQSSQSASTGLREIDKSSDTETDTRQGNTTLNTRSTIQDHYSRRVTLPEGKNQCFKVTLGPQGNYPVSTSSPKESANHSQHDKGGLRGYIPAARRAQYKVFFVSGISRNGEEIEDTLDKVKGYMESNGCKVKSVRRIKHSNRTLSVKVVVYEESARLVADSIFWPEGIQCRPWED
jgi:hypothetical protein